MIKHLYKYIVLIVIISSCSNEERLDIDFIKENILSKIDVEFDTDEKIDGEQFLLIFILIMLLGFGIPLALFYLVNALGARIQLSTLSMATVPMILSASEPCR